MVPELKHILNKTSIRTRQGWELAGSVVIESFETNFKARYHLSCFDITIIIYLTNKLPPKNATMAGQSCDGHFLYMFAH